MRNAERLTNVSFWLCYCVLSTVAVSKRWHRGPDSRGDDEWQHGCEERGGWRSGGRGREEEGAGKAKSQGEREGGWARAGKGEREGEAAQWWDEEERLGHTEDATSGTQVNCLFCQFKHVATSQNERETCILTSKTVLQQSLPSITPNEIPVLPSSKAIIDSKKIGTTSR